MGKATRPSYLINNDRTSYGYSDTIKITTLRVSAANMSLMGAMSSTPGNSTGQRTYLPAFSCSGYMCTISTPPDAHVCPPAWLMLFVLDSNGVPSVARWVLVGGDPEWLGNWPNFHVFNLPGV
jgi:hypothetical protein